MMLDQDSGLSLAIAHIVQRLKGSSLHSQLERQARVSPRPMQAGLGGTPVASWCRGRRGWARLARGSLGRRVTRGLRCLLRGQGPAPLLVPGVWGGGEIL